VSDKTSVLFETLKFYLAEWDLTLFLVKTPEVKQPEDCWFSVSPICDQLGIEDYRQRQRLQADHRFTGYLRELPVKTDAGYRTSLCMRMGKIGLWFTTINPAKVGARFQGRLEQLQADLEARAARAVLGKAADYLAPSTKRPALADNSSTSDPASMRPDATARAEIYFRCEHGTDYCIVIEDGKPTAILTGEKVGPFQEH
jgi:hypothetical protein